MLMQTARYAKCAENSKRVRFDIDRDAGRTFSFREAAEIRAGVLSAYRWQYIVSGVQRRLSDVLGRMIDAAQSERIGAALAPIMQ